MAAPVLTLLKATPGQAVYQVVGDGDAGVVTLTQALMAVDLANGPLKDTLLAVLPAANQANARAKFLGQGVSTGQDAGLWEACANVETYCRDTEANVPGIDADLDAVAVTKGEYNFDIPAVAGTYFFFINYRHSILG